MGVEKLESGKAVDFYPTPKEVAKKMLADIDWDCISTVLEPSAGKGDLADVVKDVSVCNYRESADIDCIEIDENLQHILRGKGYRVVHDDFLTFDTHKKYDLIVMNPPFSEGDKHLLKALNMQKRGGSIVCLLNAETLRNPCNHRREELVKTLEKYNANIEYLDGAFAQAERKADVDVAMVKVYIPKVQEDSEIFEHMKKAEEVKKASRPDVTDITVADYIEAAIANYNIEVASGLELIRQYLNLAPYIKYSLRDDLMYNNPILTLKVQDHNQDHDLDENRYVKAVRRKYWRALFANPKFTERMTAQLAEEYQDKVEELCDYDFSEFNIRYLLADMDANLQRGVENTIMELFDKLTAEHSWYPECNNNVHYYNGWPTNKAHKINKKVIVPTYTFSGSSYYSDAFHENWSTGKKEFDHRGAYNCLCDLEKTLNYLDGHMTANVNLEAVLRVAEINGQTKNIQCKYFDVTFYKKGTMHITFTVEDLLERLNIYAARNRKWLPPNYGKAKYADMTKEEKEVIDGFQGERDYEKVLSRPDHYIISNSRLLQLESA